jgi:hypothetical protein
MVRGFDTNFDIIDNAFINILTGGFAIDFNFIDNVFVSISAAPISTSLATSTSTFQQGDLPSALA